MTADIVLRRKSRLLGVRFGEQADFLERARFENHEVVGHQVVVFQHELDRLPGLDGDHVLVVRHPFKDRADFDDADPQLAERALTVCASAGGSRVVMLAKFA